MADFTMTIDGAPVSAERRFGVINPASGELFAYAPQCSPAQLDEAFASAATAQPGWAGDEGARRKALMAVAENLVAEIEDLAAVLTSEQGKPLAESSLEVLASSLWCQYFANIELPDHVLQDDAEARVEVNRRPLGVVAAITPWNFPLTLAFWKIAPALLAGNTIVLKPSPFTPLTTLSVGALLRRVLPPGVVNVVTGGDQLGAQLTDHRVPRKVSFTGSMETGRKVAAAAAAGLKRATLELGGNDPAIVLPDADVELVSRAIFAAAFTNNGQVCSAVKRVYVPAALHDDVVESLVAHAEGTTVGDGTRPGTRLGPINNLPQFDRISELVDDARAHGARTVAGGGALDRPGYFYAPTVVTGVDDGTRLVDEEQFGPALPVVVYTDVDDAVRRANATPYGLSGSVWGADEERAADVAGRLDCGTAWVNTHLALAPNQPFGGHKGSGVGVENGLWGLEEFTQLQVVHRSRAADGLNASIHGIVA